MTMNMGLPRRVEQILREAGLPTDTVVRLGRKITVFLLPPMNPIVGTFRAIHFKDPLTLEIKLDGVDEPIKAVWNRLVSAWSYDEDHVGCTIELSL